MLIMVTLKVRMNHWGPAFLVGALGKGLFHRVLMFFLEPCLWGQDDSHSQSVTTLSGWKTIFLMYFLFMSRARKSTTETISAAPSG